MSADESWRTIDAVRTACRIVAVLTEREGAGVSEVAAALELAPSTVHAHLKTLELEQFVVQRGETYHASLRFLDVGGAVASQRSEYELAVRTVASLAEETGERAQFVVEEHGRGVYLCTDTGDQAVQIDARIGKRNYLHASAAGKAILATMPDSRVDAIVDRWGLPPLTANTITDVEALRDELDRVRERGFAVNREESISGLRAIGVAIEDRDHDAVGALSVSGPSNRMREERLESGLVSHVLGVANELELNVQHG